MDTGEPLGRHDSHTTGQVSTLQLQVDDINKIKNKLELNAETLKDELNGSKTSSALKNKVVDLLNEYSEAFNSIAKSYMHSICTLNLRESINDSIREAVRTEIRTATRTIINPVIEEVVAKGITTSVNKRSYATCLTQTTAVRENRDNICLPRGPTLCVPNTKNIYIGPTSENVNSFRDFEAIKATVIKAVNPAQVGLKVINIRRADKNSLRLEVESADITKLKSSEALRKAGLEVKEYRGLRPRMLVRFVPSDTANDDLIKSIISMNMPDAAPDCVKIVYLYPIRENRKTRNIVIEVDPKLRDVLLNQRRVFLPWHSCPVEDHVKILQCYKCMQFSHLARDCGGEVTCGHCSESHETRDCPNRNSTPKCHNCCLAKLDHNHSAFDGTNCPILQRRIGDKVAQIAYQ